MNDSPIVRRLLEMKASGNMASGESLLEAGRKITETRLDEIALSAFENAEEDYDDVELGRLNWSPRKNWVENENGLPKYIEDVAIGIMKGSGYPREKAIPIAISRIKKWAAGLGGVTQKTQAKAIAALAKWEKMKASAKAKRLKK